MPSRAPISDKKKVPMEKIFLTSSHPKICTTNKPNLQEFRGYINDQYLSKYHTFSPRISGAMGSSMTKKQGKIRFFHWAINEGVTRDPDFRVNRTIKLSNIEELDPIWRLLFFYCNIFDKKIFRFVRFILSSTSG